MTIRYAETYCILYPENDSGEYDESGFKDEDASASFSDMVGLLDGTEPSGSPGGPHCWYSRDLGITDYSTCETETRSYHPITDRDRRYMWKAWCYANK